MNILRSIISNTAYSVMSHLPQPTVVPSELLGENKDYQKFIILSFQRSGSSLMATLLRSHPQILMFSEMYNRGKIQLGDNRFEEPSWVLKKMRVTDPIRFLNTAIYRGYRNNVAGVGFKLFPEHLHGNPRGKEITEYLKGINTLRIIYLQRHNLLKVLLSRILAERSGQWSQEAEKKNETDPVHISYEQCMEDFRHREKETADCEAFIKDKQVLSLYYEDFVKDKERHLKNIQAFLGLPEEDLTSPFKKQEKRSLADAIENYDDLKKKFQGSQYESFFTD